MFAVSSLPRCPPRSGVDGPMRTTRPQTLSRRTPDLHHVAERSARSSTEISLGVYVHVSHPNPKEQMHIDD